MADESTETVPQVDEPEVEHGDQEPDVPAKPAPVKDVLADVGDDAARAEAALAAEQAAEKPRTSLVKKLQAVIDAKAASQTVAVVLLKSTTGHVAGETVNVDEATAERLTTHGQAYRAV